MNVCRYSRSSRPASLFPLGFLDGFLGVRLRRPCLQEVSVGFGADLLVTTFMKNPG
jgi:hypothetical protein